MSSKIWLQLRDLTLLERHAVANTASASACDRASNQAADRALSVQAFAQGTEMSDSAMALAIQVNDALGTAVQSWQAAVARLPQQATGQVSQRSKPRRGHWRSFADRHACWLSAALLHCLALRWPS